MIYQPPSGARDLLPLEVEQKCWIEERLQTIFHRWGYHRIITPTLEHLDTLMAGGAIDRATVIQLQSSDDKVLGLRPELTASIARAAATRMAHSIFPQRLCYGANVFRRSATPHNRQQEFYQAGVELIGGQGPASDAEILLLLADCLSRLGLPQWHLILGDAGFTRSLLSAFPPQLQTAVRKAIAYLDRVALEQLPLSDHLRERACWLMDLRGQPLTVLRQAASLPLDAQQQRQIENLERLIHLVQDSLDPDVASAATIVLDLSLVQTFDYYTGIVFEVVSRTGSAYQSIGRGGRYDQLLGVYHPQQQSMPGVGFFLGIEDLHRVLLPTDQLPSDPPKLDWLVVPQTAHAYPSAFRYARELRTQKNMVVEICLLPDQSADAVQTYARHRQATYIAWVNAEGQTQLEPL